MRLLFHSLAYAHARLHRLGVDVAGEHWFSLPFGYLSLAFCLACCFLSSVWCSEQPLPTAMQLCFFIIAFFSLLRNFGQTYIFAIFTFVLFVLAPIRILFHFFVVGPLASAHSIDCSWRLILLHFISGEMRLARLWVSFSCVCIALLTCIRRRSFATEKHLANNESACRTRHD